MQQHRRLVAQRPVVERRAGLLVAGIEQVADDRCLVAVAVRAVLGDELVEHAVDAPAPSDRRPADAAAAATRATPSSERKSIWPMRCW